MRAKKSVVSQKRPGIRLRSPRKIRNTSEWPVPQRFVFLQRRIAYTELSSIIRLDDRLCGLVVRVPGYRSRGPGSIPTLPDFLRSSGSGTGSTQPRE
jgi:hypothetical protein